MRSTGRERISNSPGLHSIFHIKSGGYRSAALPAQQERPQQSRGGLPEKEGRGGKEKGFATALQLAADQDQGDREGADQGDELQARGRAAARAGGGRGRLGAGRA